MIHGLEIAFILFALFGLLLISLFWSIKISHIIDETNHLGKGFDKNHKQDFYWFNFPK
jgi:hypothetical protein